MNNTSLDFGYPWWLSYGHLPIVALAAALLFLGYKLHWSRWPMFLCGALFLWSSIAFLILRVGFNANAVPALPTESYLRSGSGRVLDLGAGTGRSSIMVLQARPRTTLVALDLFAQSFDQHFGREGTPQQRLMANLKIAGVDQRASIQTADMRHLPFGNAEFDGLVSAYAIDHLGRQGSAEALAEAARVIKPGGEFLLMVLTKEPWMKFAFGPLLAHGGMRPASWWTAQLQQAGFQLMEQGTRPGTLYILARRG